MASAPAAGSAGLRALNRISEIVSQDVFKRLNLQHTPNGSDGQYIATVVAAAHARIDTYHCLGERQKQDLKNIVKFSPNPSRTATFIHAAEAKGRLVEEYMGWRRGFQFFIDGGRGKRNRGSQVG
jgi:hypothetical protein